MIIPALSATCDHREEHLSLNFGYSSGKSLTKGSVQLNFFLYLGSLAAQMMAFSGEKRKPLHYS